MRLERGLRWSVYATLAVLFATGLAWWVLGGAAGTARFYLMATHGLAAMLFLVGLGAVIVLHVREGWQRRRNRGSGGIVFAIVVLLAVTAFGLYYTGSDSLRGLVTDLHLAAGLALPLILLAHVVVGIRSRPPPDLD